MRAGQIVERDTSQVRGVVHHIGGEAAVRHDPGEEVDVDGLRHVSLAVVQGSVVIGRIARV